MDRELLVWLGTTPLVSYKTKFVFLRIQDWAFYRNKLKTERNEKLNTLTQIFLDLTINFVFCKWKNAAEASSRPIGIHTFV